MRIPKILLFILLTLLASFKAPKVDSPPQQVAGTDSEFVKVTRIVDGDTIVIEGERKLRYIGIDTPETVDPRKTVQCFGKEAAQKNKELVEGKLVRLEKDISETDRFGRLLRYVYLGDTMINEVLVQEGFAHAYSYPPDIKYQTRLVAAELQAKNLNKGLWTSCIEKNSI